MTTLEKSSQFEEINTLLVVSLTIYNSKKTSKLIAIDLSKQLKLDADPKSIEEINFTRNLVLPGNTAMFFIIKEPKETVLDFT